MLKSPVIALTLLLCLTTAHGQSVPLVASYPMQTAGGKLPQNARAHLAFTFKKGDQGRIYIHGQQVSIRETPYAFWPVGDPLRLGGADWAGALDEVHIYGAQLTAEQVKLDMQGQLTAV